MSTDSESDLDLRAVEISAGDRSALRAFFATGSRGLPTSVVAAEAAKPAACCANSCRVRSRKSMPRSLSSLVTAPTRKNALHCDRAIACGSRFIAGGPWSGMQERLCMRMSHGLCWPLGTTTRQTTSTLHTFIASQCACGISQSPWTSCCPPCHSNSDWSKAS